MLGAASIRGVPAFGLPKISSFVGGIFHSRFFRFSAVVDQRKQRDSFGLQNIFDPVHRLLNRVIAWLC